MEREESDHFFEQAILEGRIDSDVETGHKSSGRFGNSIRRFFNNFDSHLPGGWSRMPDLMTDEEEVPYWTVWIDLYSPRLLERSYHKPKTYEEASREPAFRAFFEDHSERRLKATDQEFYDEIDSCLAERGDFEKVQGHVLQLNAVRNSSNDRLINQQWTQLLPFLVELYRSLRQKGYAHLDLVS